MNYQHHDIGGCPIDLPVGKVVCVGRNYADHIEELNNETPQQPLLFMKPSDALCDVSQPIEIPVGLGTCHNELEIAVLIAQTLKNADVESCEAAVWGVGLGLDLTLRDLQSQLKAKGLPWERAKSFDQSCPVSRFVPSSSIESISNLSFSLTVNSEVRQFGDCTLMLWSIPELLSAISSVFTLRPGDVVLTGTPKGVGPLKSNDQLSLDLDNHFKTTTSVV